MNLEFFPPLNATLNSLAFLCLTAGYYFIRFRRDPITHRKFMVAAVIFSITFLGCYVTYHTLKQGLHTRFGGTGFMLYFYYAMLVSHVLLAIVNLPLIVITVWLAAKKRYTTHRKWARWTFPIWYYVSFTGVLVYFFLYQWYPGERL